MKKTVSQISLLLLLGCAAVSLGVAGGSWLRDRGLESHRVEQADRTEAILSSMQGIGMGDTIPNYTLYDLEGTPMKLDQLVKPYCILLFFRSNCQSCASEFGTIEQEANSTSDAPLRLVFISPQNPFELRDYFSSSTLSHRIFYDHERRFEASFDISTYPFNILVDSTAVVRGFLAGPLDSKILEHTVAGDLSKLITFFSSNELAD